MNTVQNLFLRLFVPLTIILIGGTWFYGQQEIEHELIQLHNHQTLNVRLGAGALSTSINSLNSDLKFLSRHSALLSAIKQSTEDNLSHLAEDFSIFSKNKQIYDQIRWIDETGMEKVRVDYMQGKTVVIATSQLQNKSQRYYVTDALRLEPGEVFISAFDLNIEHNEIEVPYKPMIRLATPVVDQQGNKRGIIILNYYGAEILESFAMATIDIAGHSMVINRQGYWLKSPNPANEWGFMFNRPDLSLAKFAPIAWKQISSADNGQLSFDSGDWTWETVYPLLENKKNSTATPEANADSLRYLEARQYYWKVVSHISTDRLNAIKQVFWFKLAGIASFLLITFGLGSWKLAHAWTLLAEAELNYRTVADFTYDWETWITPTGDYRYCSPSCLRHTGHSANDFVNEPKLLIDITHPDDHTLLVEHLNKHTTTEELYKLQFRIILPDGQIRWMDHACVPVFGAAGDYLGRRAVNRDITVSVQAEQLLRENESRLKDMFENLKSGVAIYQLSADGENFIITGFNRAAELIEQTSRENLIGRNVAEVFPGVTDFGLLEVFHRVWKTGKAEHFPISFYQDGRISGWRENYIYKLPNGDIVSIYDDVTEKKQAEENLQYIANYDQLTGLPNRLLLADRSIQTISLAKRNNSHIALMFLDLDDFKPVNDKFGHDVGDLVLKEVANRLRDHMRESDTVSRIGGDEFVLLISNIQTAQDALRIAENIRIALQQAIIISGHTIKISSSIGIAIYPEHGDNIDILTRKADQAMYHAKNSGRNIFKLYQAEMSDNN